MFLDLDDGQAVEAGELTMKTQKGSQMTIFKTLAIAAALAAVITPAKAFVVPTPSPTSPAYLVKFPYERPIGCRNLDDAIEASKIDRNAAPAPGAYYVPVVDFVNRHQAGSKMDGYFRVPPKRDCRFDKGSPNILEKSEPFEFSNAVEIKLFAPNLPPGTIAICVDGTLFLGDNSKRPRPDCSGTLDAYKAPVAYWIVVKPTMFYRNFDLPKGE
jgi:hypothetical protein